MAELAHAALNCLHEQGLRPMVNVVDRSEMLSVAEVEKSDPFHLISALHKEEAGSQGSSVAVEESEPRWALMSGTIQLKD